MTASRHIAVIAPPLAGHYDPLLVLARQLERHGHRITFFHIEDARAVVERQGFAYRAVGGDRAGPGTLEAYVRRLGHTGAAGLTAMIRETAALTALLLDTLPGALDAAGVDAVIADSTEPAGALVARHLRLPFVTSVTGLPLLREAGVPPPFVGWPYRGGMAGRIRNSGGHWVTDLLMRPVAREVARRAVPWGLDPQEEGGFSPLLQVAQCPPGLDFPRQALPPAFRYVGPWREAAAPADLAGDGRPLVYCSLGSLQGGRPAVFARMSAACADLGARAVVAHGGRLGEAEAKALPGDPLVAAFWNQPAVLPGCAAALVHGGFNTVVDALAAGVPMAVAPIAFEQPATAARLAYHGAGVVVRGHGRARFRQALQRILDDANYREAAERLAAEIAAGGGAVRAAALVDEAFRTGRTPAARPEAATTASPDAGDVRGDTRRNGSR